MFKLNPFINKSLVLLAFLIFIGCINSCFLDFNNPIDPENSGAIPPAATAIHIAQIPYKDIIVHRGTFEFNWQYAQGLILQRSANSEGPWISIDTLYSPEHTFSDQILASDSSRYFYRLLGYNLSGLGLVSDLATPSSQDSIDLFAPEVNPFVAKDPVIHSKTVTSPIFTLRLKIFDESSIQKVQVSKLNQTLVTTTLDSIWFNTSDTLKSYTQKYFWKVQDGSSEGRITQDSLLVYYDMPNKPLTLQLQILDNKSLKFSWNSAQEKDFYRYKIWVSSQNVNVKDSATSSKFLATDTNITLNEMLDGQKITIALQDSAGNILQSTNSTIRKSNGRFYRQQAVWIPSGEFSSPKTTKATLSKGFWMDTVEVSQRQFLKYSLYNPAIFNGLDKALDNATWIDALKYCNSRSVAEGLDSVYSYTSISGQIVKNLSVNANANGYRLATADEWEFAARAGTNGTDYIWGNSEDSTLVELYAWFDDNAGNNRDSSGLNPAAEGGPQKGAQLRANANGLYDMAGNVDEWVYDFVNSKSPDSIPSIRSDYSGESTCTGNCLFKDVQNLVFPEPTHVVMGSNWSYEIPTMRLYLRYGLLQSARSRLTGFRTVMNGAQ